jgi:hypothetical protein
VNNEISTSEEDKPVFLYVVAGTTGPRHKRSALLSEVLFQQDPRVLLAGFPVRTGSSGKCFGTITQRGK